MSRNWQDGPSAVYRHFDAEGQLLYIGCSTNPGARHQTHRCTSHWALKVATISVQWFENRAAAMEAEAAAISAEAPLHNIQHHPVRPRKKWDRANAHPFIRAWMKAEGLSLRAAAERCGMSPSRFREIADGEAVPRRSGQEAIVLGSNGLVPDDCWGRGRWASEYRPVSSAEAAASVQKVRDLHAYRLTLKSKAPEMEALS